MTIEAASAGKTTATTQPRHANHWLVLLLVFTLAGVVESQAFGHLTAFRPLYLQQLGVPSPNIATWTGILAALAQSLFPVQLDIIGMGLFQGGIGTTVIALLALLSPEERRAPILNFSLLPSQLSWFFGPITGAALARVTLTLPFFAGSGTVALALVFACVLALGARKSPGEATA